MGMVQQVWVDGFFWVRRVSDEDSGTAAGEGVAVDLPSAFFGLSTECRLPIVLRELWVDSKYGML